MIWLCAMVSANAGLVSSFQAGDGGWQMGTLGVGNLNGGPQLEIVVPYRNSSGLWFLDAFKIDGTRMPGFPYLGGASPINVSPTLFDLNGDGRDEILFTCGDRVVALKGDGTTIWSSQVNSFNYVPDSGFMTVTNGFYWSDGGAFIPNLPPTAVFSSEVSSPMVADVNGDGVRKVVTAWKIKPDPIFGFQDYNPFISEIWGSGEWGTQGENWSGGVVFFDAGTGAKDYTYHFCQLVESGLALGHADQNQPLETYVLNDSDSVVCFDKTKPHGLFGKGNLHKQFGKNQRLMTGAYQIGVDVYTTDLDGDGLAEVLVPTTQNGTLWQPSETILDDDGTILWRKWKQNVSFPLDQWQNNACMIPINPDHDNHIDVLSFTHSYEIAYRYWNGVELVDHPGWPKNFYPFLPTPPVVGDVDGDGQEEIIIGTYNPTDSSADGALYVYGLDGTLKFSVPVPGGLKHIPSLANVDGHGLDVIYRSLTGMVYIQNFGATKSGPVSWATHRGNQRRDGNLGVSLFPPGTPLITQRQSGYRRASFSWGGDATNKAQAWRIYRAEQPEGPFLHVATVIPSVFSYTDYQLKAGQQYIYEVGAVYQTNEVHSAPFAILSALNGNLISNGGFEENDNSHWDKWFTGDIDWTNMVASTNVFYQGRKSMQVTLMNNSDGGSISQFDQYGTPDSFLPVTPGQLYSFGCFFKSGGLSQPSEHWMEWSSTPTGEDPSARPIRPWPYYFTPHFVIGTDSTDWTYANRTFILPDGFPNVELGHRYSISAPGSGSIYMDNVYFRALPSPSSTNWTELLPFGATWKYSVDPPPVNWAAPEFDDSNWPAGAAKLGAGSGPTNIATQITPQMPAYYFRRSFVSTGAPFEELLLSATCTTGGTNYLDIYLNGVRLVTSGIDAVSLQGNEMHYYDLTPFLDLLRVGTNTIAVVMNNIFDPDWDDVAFDIDLKACSYSPAGTAVTRITGPPSRDQGSPRVALDLDVPPNTIWQLESTDTLFPPSWQLVDTVTSGSTGSSVFQDTGQSGRVPPNQATTRFYRLRAY